MSGMDSYLFNNTEGAKQIKKKLMEQYDELFECPNGGDVKVCDCAFRGDSKCAEDCNACKLWLLLADLIRDQDQYNHIVEESVDTLMKVRSLLCECIEGMDSRYPIVASCIDRTVGYNGEDYPDPEEEEDDNVDDLDDLYDDLDVDDISGLIEED